MKSYMVLVEAEDYIEVEAESEAEAEERAVGIAESNVLNWKTTILNEKEI